MVKFCENDGKIQRESTVKGQGKGTNPNSLKAIEACKWKKGQSGNPKGKEKGSLSLKERMNKFLGLNVKVKMPDGTIKEQEVLDSIIMSLLAQAQKGNIVAIKEVFERNFGKEADKLEVISHEEFLKSIND